MTECERDDWFARGKARGEAFRHRVETCAAYLIDRIRDAHAMPGEILEEFSTVRGLAEVLGCKKSATHALLQRFKSLEAFAHRPIRRRWETNTPSPTQGSNPYWWMPTIWRIGPALSKFFDGVFEYGTNIADSLLGSQKRTRVNPPSAGEISEADERKVQENQSFQNGFASCPVLGRSVDIEGLITAVDRLNVRLVTEGDRPPTIEEAQTALRSVHAALDRLMQPTTRVDVERRQRAEKALTKAEALASLAELACRPRIAPPRFVNPSALSRPPGYR